MEKITREFFLGFIRIHILHHAAKEPIFGQRFNEELSRHGYEISYGTLYPIFHGL
jgi:DNA-binding PadR family transcriptional regulator